MQISQLQIKGLKQEYKVVVPAQDIEKNMEERLHVLGKKTRLPGFRPGKIPLGILKQRYGQQALKEALDYACNSSVNKIVKDNSLRQAIKPNISIVNFNEGKDLELKIALEVLPEVQLQDFAKIKLEKLQVQISDSDIDKKLEELVNKQVKYQALAKNSAAKKGDRLQLEVQAKIDEKPITDFEKQIYVVLGDEAKILFGGIEAVLEGAKVGEIVEATEQFPQEFSDKKLAGKLVTFNLTVKKIEESSRFKLDQDFAKEMGCENLEDLKKRVRDAAEKEYSNLARLWLKRHLLDNLSEQYNFDLPESLVSNEFTGIWNRLQEELANARNQGTIDADDNRPEDELRKEYGDIAARRVRLGLLISEISRLNNINVSEEEIRQAIFAEAMRYPQQINQVVEFYQKNSAAVEQLVAVILEDKVVDFILAGSSLKERHVNIEELTELIRGVVPGYEEDDKKITDNKTEKNTDLEMKSVSETVDENEVQENNPLKEKTAKATTKPKKVTK